MLRSRRGAGSACASTQCLAGGGGGADLPAGMGSDPFGAAPRGSSATRRTGDVSERRRKEKEKRKQKRKNRKKR